MSKILKNIIMIFTLLCVIFVIVFCVELFLLNRESDDTPEPALSNNDANDPSDDPFGEDDPFPFDDLFLDSAEPDDMSGPGVTPPINATRQSFLLSQDAELVFYVDMELFGIEELGSGWYFPYLSDGNAGLEVNFTFIQPQAGIAALADNFLYNLLDGEETIIQGEQSIGRSPVRGVFVTGENNGEIYSAWLRSLSDFGSDTLALVVRINYETDAQRDIIFSILDTMYINILTETSPDGD